MRPGCAPPAVGHNTNGSSASICVRLAPLPPLFAGLAPTTHTKPHHNVSLWQTAQRRPCRLLLTPPLSRAEEALCRGTTERRDRRRCLFCPPPPPPPVNNILYPLTTPPACVRCIAGGRAPRARRSLARGHSSWRHHHPLFKREIHHPTPSPSTTTMRTQRERGALCPRLLSTPPFDSVLSSPLCTATASLPPFSLSRRLWPHATLHPPSPPTHASAPATQGPALCGRPLPRFWRAALSSRLPPLSRESLRFPLSPGAAPPFAARGPQAGCVCLSRSKLCLKTLLLLSCVALSSPLMVLRHAHTPSHPAPGSRSHPTPPPSHPPAPPPPSLRTPALALQHCAARVRACVVCVCVRARPPPFAPARPPPAVQIVACSAFCACCGY